MKKRISSLENKKSSFSSLFYSCNPQCSTDDKIVTYITLNVKNLKVRTQYRFNKITMRKYIKMY